MLDEVSDAAGIRKAAEQLLARADVRGRLPTPVSDIVTAAGLVEPEHSMLSDLVIDQAPEYLRGPIRRLRFKVQALLDRKTREIHVDPSIDNDGKIAFKRLHEVTHDILPWQSELGYADDAATFAWSAHQLFERQANQGAAELLFQRQLFTEMAAEYEIGFAAIVVLGHTFGATAHASFRRFVETHHWPIAGVVLELSPCSADPLGYRRKEAICSPSWAEQFGSTRAWPKVLQIAPFAFVSSVTQARMSDEPIRTLLSLPNLDSSPTALVAELYCNSYNVFVLLWRPRGERLRRRRVIVSSSSSIEVVAR